MNKNKTIHWAQWLVLPLLLAACGGHSSSENMAVQQPAETPPPAPAAEQANVASVAPKGISVPPEETKTTAKPAKTSAAASVSPAVAPTQPASAPTTTPATAKAEPKKEPKTEPKKESKTEPETATKMEPKTEPAPDPLAKTAITPELTETVKKAKATQDLPPLPRDFEAEYVINSAAGEKTVTLKAPEGSSDDGYAFNGSDVFPLGESTGTMKSSLLSEDGGTREPHTEETFMSYQQFYSGITGSQKQVVYFADGAIERDEPFYVNMPTGLITPADGLPSAGEATYHGKALDGKRFGDFQYQVDFANKMGKGGAITWDKTTAGDFGDIELAAGEIKPQVLSVYQEPDLWPDDYSHRGAGISGAVIVKDAAAEAPKLAFTAVFFGLKAEEFGGLIYEDQAPPANSNPLSGETIEKKNVISFTGER